MIIQLELNTKIAAIIITTSVRPAGSAEKYKNANKRIMKKVIKRNENTELNSSLKLSLPEAVSL